MTDASSGLEPSPRFSNDSFTAAEHGERQAVLHVANTSAREGRRYHVDGRTIDVRLTARAFDLAW
jgi:hypothetical protein